MCLCSPLCISLVPSFYTLNRALLTASSPSTTPSKTTTMTTTWPYYLNRSCISLVPSFDVKQSVANHQLPEHYTKQNDHNDNNMAIRITLKTIDYYKFRKMVVDGNRDDYAVCSKDVRTLCDSVQTILFRDEEFDDVSDRMRFDEICKYVYH